MNYSFTFRVPFFQTTFQISHGNLNLPTHVKSVGRAAFPEWGATTASVQYQQAALDKMFDVLMAVLSVKWPCQSLLALKFFRSFLRILAISPAFDCNCLAWRWTTVLQVTC